MVAKHETTAFGGVRVQINVNIQVLVFVLLNDHFFDAVNRGLLFRAGVTVESVEILGKSV